MSESETQRQESSGEQTTEQRLRTEIALGQIDSAADQLTELSREEFTDEERIGQLQEVEAQIRVILDILRRGDSAE